MPGVTRKTRSPENGRLGTGDRDKAVRVLVRSEEWRAFTGGVSYEIVQEGPWFMGGKRVGVAFKVRFEHPVCTPMRRWNTLTQEADGTFRRRLLNARFEVTARAWVEIDLIDNYVNIRPGSSGKTIIGEGNDWISDLPAPTPN
ncbi:hypothetical protein [Actinocorallia aurea]